ncbi:hypothetical protein SARC_07793 [Sphaeroforma arctica JP610]|uniref:Uncharacterized protein n=1 Tax=Sphaeroforma arctica JP610 TaxID=667725 RepID=A0A0L0FV68_9EUKA|nr:hypothetical protein SARC_07793 [Sphaeroforma arctica JP610]KNC79833.1 hypothetical protein SARC_07793 [Sphaeroforma arctica JP610]|eukprot:XP_014153735.1 hypothetical protein SARC_07793 [Sphaeroforma arctica JP610]
MCSWQASPDDLAAEYILSKLDVNPHHILMAIRGEAMAMFVAALKYYPDVLTNCKPTQLEDLAIAVMKESRDAHTDSIFRVLMLKIGMNEIRTGENFAYEAYLLGAEMHNKPDNVMRVIRSLPGFSELENTSLYEETMVWGNAFINEKSKVADLVVFCGMCLRAHFNDQMAEHVVAKLIQVMAHAVSLGERHVRHIRMVINKHRIASWDDLLVGVEAMVAKGKILDARTIAATR